MKKVETDFSIIIENEKGDVIEYDKLEDIVFVDTTDISFDMLMKMMRMLKQEVKKYKKQNFEL